MSRIDISRIVQMAQRSIDSRGQHPAQSSDASPLLIFLGPVHHLHIHSGHQAAKDQAERTAPRKRRRRRS